MRPGDPTGPPSRAAHAKEIRALKVLKAYAPRMFPEVTQKAVWELWHASKDEQGFRDAVEAGKLAGVPDWFRLDGHAPVEPDKLLFGTFDIPAVRTAVELSEAERGPAAVLFAVARRGDWVVHNLALGVLLSGTVRVDAQSPDGGRLLIERAEDFARRRETARTEEYER